jgi:dienelactone hydrolase
VRLWKITMPVLMLLAGEDDVAPGKRCQEAVQRSAVAETVKIVVYPEAQHAFDVSELPPKMQYPAGTIGYHPHGSRCRVGGDAAIPAACEVSG